jgi:hypothetical protein
MRGIIGTIGATMAIVALMAISASGAFAGSGAEASRPLLDVSTDNTDVLASTGPCEPCGMDGGTGTEILFDAVADWVDDWFDDYDSGDLLHQEVDISGDKAVLVTAEPEGGSPMPTSNPVLAAQMT